MPKNNTDMDKTEEGKERKKKNAAAQAAFRARRANYISTLEETVTSLESVVLQLQDSCREARSEVSDLRQENTRLRHHFHEREKLWRNFCQARKTEHGGADEESPSLPPPPPPPFSPVQGSLGVPAGHPHQSGYTDNFGYQTDEHGHCGSGQSHAYSSHSSSMSYTGTDSENTSADSSSRFPKFAAQYHYTHHSNRDVQWPHQLSNNDSSGAESSGGAPASTTSHSPNYQESPTLISADMSYSSRKNPLNELDTAPYVFPITNRSLSPPVASPSSSTALTSTFPFTFPDNSMPSDRTDYEYQRQPVHAGDINLNGEMSLTGPGADAVRYRLETRERHMLPVLPVVENDHREDSDGETYSHRDIGASYHASRSPSPGVPSLSSGTLAVIKAQAFGALRRTRTRKRLSDGSPRPLDGSSKMAMDVLDSRGLGASSSSKRPRLHQDVA